MRRSNNKKVNKPYIPASSRTETGEHVIKLGSIPLEALKQSDAYKNRIEVKGSWVKRKYACCFAYFGTNYQGLQMNPDCKSVEAELERALFLSGCFYEDNYGFLQKLQWTRAARTDRGVHALGQCCAMRLFVPSDVAEKEEMISNINSFLPADIRCMALTKVTKTFNAHTGCSSRIYSYLLPTYLFTDMIQMNEWLSAAYQQQGPIIDCAHVGGYVEPGSDKYLGYDALQQLRMKHDDNAALTSLRCSPEKLALFRKCLKFYEGTKSYHNFTTGKEAGDDSSKRYITSVTSSDPFLLAADGTMIPSSSSLSSSSSSSSAAATSVVDGTDTSTQQHIPIEWICVTIMGQSFVLNQIRKMMCLAIDITRGVIDFNTMHSLVDLHCRSEVAMAPALGLYVNKLFFTSYNSKQTKDRERKLSDTTIAKSRAEYRAKGNSSGSNSNNNRNSNSKSTLEQIKAHAMAAVQRALQGTTTTTHSSNDTSSNSSSDSSYASNNLVSNIAVQQDEDAYSKPIEKPTNDNDEQEDVNITKKARISSTENNDDSSNIHIATTVPDEAGVATVKQEEGEDSVDKQKEGDDKEDERGEDEDDTMNLGGELIEWWTEEPTKTRIEEFRTLQLWPHIVQQEKEGLSFLFYLDSLRIKTKSLYKGKFLTASRAEQNNNSNTCRSSK